MKSFISKFITQTTSNISQTPSKSATTKEKRLLVKSIKRLRKQKEQILTSLSDSQFVPIEVLSIESQLERAEKTAQDYGLIV